VVIQDRDEKLRDSIMALEANEDIMTRLRTFYQDLLKDPSFPAKDSSLQPGEKSVVEQNILDFCTQMDEYIYETRTQIRRAKVLSTLVADRKQIVSLQRYPCHVKCSNANNRS
jgi:hypothetical protein